MTFHALLIFSFLALFYSLYFHVKTCLGPSGTNQTNYILGIRTFNYLTWITAPFLYVLAEPAGKVTTIDGAELAFALPYKSMFS